ncbi:hypothetical protein [Microbacterium aurantiacum]|nr:MULTISPECIES: hypothetical protein [Microbacterium]
MVAYSRGVEFLMVAIVCAAGLAVPIALGTLPSQRRRRYRARR